MGHQEVAEGLGYDLSLRFSCPDAARKFAAFSDSFMAPQWLSFWVLRVRRLYPCPLQRDSGFRGRFWKENALSTQAGDPFQGLLTDSCRRGGIF